jgi:predicted MFS family arabinose efflux permease
LVTLVAGPALVERLTPRTSVMAGAVLCAAAVAGFGEMRGSLTAYYGLWILYMTGWTLAGPMKHQLLLAQIFDKERGSALAAAFFGLSLFGALSVVCLSRPLTQAYGPAMALRLTGATMLLAVPIAWFCLPGGLQAGKPSAREVEDGQSRPWGSPAFWLLLCGGALTASGIAGIIQHWKLILRERGFTNQERLDELYGWTMLLMLACSALGRFAFGWSLDRFSKRRVITLAFALMLAAMPLLYLVGSVTAAPYVFALLFGLGMSSDTLLVTLLAAGRFRPKALAKAMGVLVPVTTVGQTWFPFGISLLWTKAGNYTSSLVTVFLFILCGRLLLYLVKERDAEPI